MVIEGGSAVLQISSPPKWRKGDSFTHPADGGQKRSRTFSVGRTVDGSTSCVLLEWKWRTDNWLAATHNLNQSAWK